MAHPQAETNDGRGKAYLVTYTITNEMQALVYAENANEARESFRAGEIEWTENTGNDGRGRGVKVRRFPEEDDL